MSRVKTGRGSNQYRDKGNAKPQNAAPAANLLSQLVASPSGLLAEDSPETDRFVKEQWAPGEHGWFEYHCLESPESGDAQAWYRSHQQVQILTEQNSDAYIDEDGHTSFELRSEAGQPKVYRVQFPDGLEWDVFEDELLTDPAGYSRPDPPPQPSILNGWPELPELLSEIADIARAHEPDWDAVFEGQQHDWCGEASRDTAAYLNQIGITAQVHIGGLRGCHHSWVELADGTIIDPTIEQYIDRTQDCTVDRSEVPWLSGLNGEQVAVVPPGHPLRAEYQTSPRRRPVIFKRHGSPLTALEPKHT
jgi:hypothetical protein